MGRVSRKGYTVSIAAYFISLVDALATPRRLRRRPQRGNSDASLAGVMFASGIRALTNWRRARRRFVMNLRVRRVQEVFDMVATRPIRRRASCRTCRTKGLPVSLNRRGNTAVCGLRFARASAKAFSITA